MIIFVQNYHWLFGGLPILDNTKVKGLQKYISLHPLQHCFPIIFSSQSHTIVAYFLTFINLFLNIINAHFLPFVMTNVSFSIARVETKNLTFILSISYL